MVYSIGAKGGPRPRGAGPTRRTERAAAEKLCGGARAVGWLCVLGLGASVLHAMPANAQALPPSGNAELSNPRALSDFDQRMQEQSLQKAARTAPETTTVKAADDVPIPAGAERITFVLKGIAFSDSQVFSKSDLDAFTAPYLGRTISVADLFRITAKVNATYRERGYITAQALLVPQQIAGGVARIELVEGTIGNVIISGNQRVKSSFVIDRVEVLPGSIPTIQLLERRLSAVNSNRNFRVTAGLKPGEKPGTTDLQLDVSGERAPLSGSVYINNQGTREGGRFTLGATASFYSLFGYDELLSFGVTKSTNDFNKPLQDFDVGSYFADASLPLPYGNGNVRLLFSHSNSQVLEGSFASLGIDGRGDLASITGTQPVYTTPTLNLSVYGGGQWGLTESKVGIVDTDTHAYRFLAGVKSQSTFPTTGTYLETDLRVIQSLVNVKGLSGPDEESVTRLVGSATLYQDVGDGVSLLMRAAGQYTRDKRLPSGELWYLGGSTSLPAYELSSLSGDTGFYLANQVRYGSVPINEAVGQALGMPFNSGVRAFFDVGAVFDDYLRGEPSSFYADFGLGYDFDIGGHLNGDLSVAWPVDPDMNDTIDVANPRFLFTVSANF
jgi:hemolysin activation/secretion protein